MLNIITVNVYQFNVPLLKKIIFTIQNAIEIMMLTISVITTAMVALMLLFIGKTQIQTDALLAPYISFKTCKLSFDVDFWLCINQSVELLS